MIWPLVYISGMPITISSLSRGCLCCIQVIYTRVLADQRVAIWIFIISEKRSYIGSAREVVWVTRLWERALEQMVAIVDVAESGVDVRAGSHSLEDF